MDPSRRSEIGNLVCDFELHCILGREINIVSVDLVPDFRRKRSMTLNDVFGSLVIENQTRSSVLQRTSGSKLGLLVLRWSMKVLDFVAFLDFAPRYAMTAMELICPALYNVSSMGTLRKKL
jgi:hypothetical protein